MYVFVCSHLCDRYNYVLASVCVCVFASMSVSVCLCVCACISACMCICVHAYMCCVRTCIRVDQIVDFVVIDASIVSVHHRIKPDTDAAVLDHGMQQMV